MVAIKYYFPSSGAAPVSPAFDAGWEVTSDAVRYPMPTTPGVTVLGLVTAVDNGNSAYQDLLAGQFVSDAIAAQTIPVQPVKIQMQAYEYTGTANLFLSFLIKVVSNDGTTVRGTLLPLTLDNTELNVGTQQNRRFTATTSSVVAQANDRIVVEVGFSGDPGGTSVHGWRWRVGEDASSGNLPEDDTENVITSRSWLELSGLAGGGGGPGKGGKPGGGTIRPGRSGRWRSNRQGPGSLD